MLRQPTSSLLSPEPGEELSAESGGPLPMGLEEFIHVSGVEERVGFQVIEKGGGQR
jgi:hypothetical protein